ncbi:MAG: hypothetical protein U9N61_02855 [Euryarchaeota archaeon]|nr:hypothetical protein [Euryarchaeota archaeon]
MLPKLQEECKEWVRDNCINGTGKSRADYALSNDVGEIAKKYWDTPAFTLGIEYGMKILGSKLFGDLGI